MTQELRQTGNARKNGMVLICGSDLTLTCRQHKPRKLPLLLSEKKITIYSGPPVNEPLIRNKWRHRDWYGLAQRITQENY